MENKVICECFNVSTNDIKNAIKSGIKTFKDLQDKTNIGTECPPCTENSEKIFIELLNETSK